jgi:hypothetical protein
MSNNFRWYLKLVSLVRIIILGFVLKKFWAKLKTFIDKKLSVKTLLFKVYIRVRPDWKRLKKVSKFSSFNKYTFPQSIWFIVFKRVMSMVNKPLSSCLFSLSIRG